MLHKAWSSIEEAPYCFPRSSIKFKVTRDNISPISTRIERFWTVNPVWIHQWIWNDAQSLTWYRRSALLFFEVIHQISRSHGRKNWRFESNLRLLGRPQLSNPSDLPCFIYFTFKFEAPFRLFQYSSQSALVLPSFKYIFCRITFNTLSWHAFRSWAFIKGTDFSELCDAWWGHSNLLHFPLTKICHQNHRKFLRQDIEHFLHHVWNFFIKHFVRSVTGHANFRGNIIR